MALNDVLNDMDVGEGMTVPHQFPSLLSGPAQTVLIAGTGLSAKVAPTLPELKPTLDAIADNLAVVSTTDNFYVLAEAILAKLESDGRSGAESRLYLAEELGMLDDRRWFGDIGVRRNTPRHRALARFAVEKRLQAIISLNWDSLLEAALDGVGLVEVPCSPRPPRPWDITQYARVVDDAHIPLLASNNVFPVIKPHGCVRELESIRREVRLGKPCPTITLRVTEAELNRLADGQKQIDKQVESYVARCPLLAIGWSASEAYLRTTIVAAVNEVQPTEAPDIFTLISRSWYQNHDEIANAYETTKALSFLPVGKVGQPTLDCVLQWLQALYALSKLIGAVTNQEEATLRELHEQTCTDHPVLKWADTWLPAWVRMCWRAGLVQGVDPTTNKKIAPWDMPMMPRDAHVPLGSIPIERVDLQSAAKLLITIRDNLNRFDYETFPGGLWDSKEQVLYLPLPGCRGEAHSSALTALKPLVEEWTWSYVKNGICLIWLDNVDAPPEENDKTRLEAQVRMLTPSTGLAGPDTLSWLTLEELKGG